MCTFFFCLLFSTQLSKTLQDSPRLSLSLHAFK